LWCCIWGTVRESVRCRVRRGRVAVGCAVGLVAWCKETSLVGFVQRLARSRWTIFVRGVGSQAATVGAV